MALLTGCPPSHVNPLDPESPHYIPPDTTTPLNGFHAHVRSVHTSRNIPSTDTYSVLCEAWAEEAGRIDTAWLAYVDFPSVGMRLSIENVWSASLTSSYFGDPQLGSVVGQPFHFYLRTPTDSICVLEPIYLFRVIEQTPVLTFPRNSETVGPFPVLQWEDFPENYPFSYHATVVLRAGEFEAVIWQRDGLPADTLQTVVDDSLEDGNYYWTLHVVDGFKNTSRSKEGLFTVQGEVNL